MSRKDDALARLRAYPNWDAFRELHDGRPMLADAVVDAIREGATPEEVSELVAVEMKDLDLASLVLRAARHVAARSDREPLEGE